ncbi:Uncharacterised protein [Mycobacteroides abscessus subsp. massiliense]|nr:Uncharacterised protein [Mycobacteroides abscessus subsp. massiliense]
MTLACSSFASTACFTASSYSQRKMICSSYEGSWAAGSGCSFQTGSASNVSVRLTEMPAPVFSSMIRVEKPLIRTQSPPLLSYRSISAFWIGSPALLFALNVTCTHISSAHGFRTSSSSKANGNAALNGSPLSVSSALVTFCKYSAA